MPPQSPEVRAVLKRPFAEQVAFFRGKLGNLVPTARWDDIWKSQHDRAFMVAGAAKADLLADLAAAVDRSITEGGSIGQFRKDFDALVAKHGWDYTGERNWRTRTIYRTNAATSYAAGRLAQLREGGFPFWMYKHGGSADPRPQHLAWNGMVLPADHPFWQTHSPPNGWGCSCRIVGVRDKDMARRLGGKPDMGLPEGWDNIDVKTGEPAGIDRGWGYQPGATVVDTVQQMAAKTQQWEYTLAKSFMEGVPADRRDALARAYRALPSVADDTRLYAQRILEGPIGTEVPPYRTLGLLTRAQATEVAEKIGRKVDGFDFAVGRDAPIHIRATHGDSGAEGLRGQRAVMPQDYARLPLIVDDPDAIQPAGLSGVGHPIVRFIRVIDGEKFIAALEVRSGRKTLALQSLWVGKP